MKSFRLKGHSGAVRRAEPGTQEHRISNMFTDRCAWVPGSRAAPAPRNDGVSNSPEVKAFQIHQMLKAGIHSALGVGLIGGAAAIAQAAVPVLDALFPKRFHIGKAGDGGRAKLAVNHILALNRLALAEGLVFAARLGLDPAAFLKVARDSAAASQVMDTKGPKMIAGEFSPEGRVRQSLKDAHLMLDQARKAGQKLPLLEIHAQVLQACIDHGEAERDNSIVIEEIRRRRG